VRTTDNNGGRHLDEIVSDDEKYNVNDLKRIANIKIENLKIDEYPNLLLFPQKWNAYHDDVYKSEIFSFSNDNILKTNNIMGFLGLNDTNITICSRFAKDDYNDYFLHYMLKKVMAINVVNLSHSGGKNKIWNFLVFLFPFFLKRALSKGLYKEYINKEYNNANIRGVIDVKKHLRVNTPFSGNIIYSTREYSNDNPVMQLIRHTIEYIKAHKYNNILTNNTEIFANIKKVILATQMYNKNDRQKIINININKPVVHTYFIEYKELQRICIRILTNEKISTNNDKEKIHGILFNGAWLWEEYLNTILADAGFEHPRNKTGEKGYSFFKDDDTGKLSGRIYPDFIKKSDPPIIIDAKYKYLEKYLKSENDKLENKYFKAGNADYYQVITYMFRFNSKTGCLIFPYPGNNLFKKEKTLLKGFNKQTDNDKVILLGMKIPKPEKDSTFKNFKIDMEVSENELKNELKTIY